MQVKFDVLKDKRLKGIKKFIDSTISDTVIGALTNRVNEVGIETAFIEILHYLDCTRFDAQGVHRMMQTIGVPYVVELTKALYIIEMYDYNGIDALVDRHNKNVEYEKLNPPEIYLDKKPKQTTKRSKTTTKEKKEKKPKMTSLERKLAQFGSFNIKI